MKKKWKIITAIVLVLGVAAIAWAGTVSVQPNGLATPKWYGYSSGAKSTYYLAAPTLSANDTACGIAATQTLTNKTLTSPTMTTPSMTSPTVSSGGVTFGMASAIYHASVTVTNAEIKALRASPKVLVSAPGAGKIIEFVSAVIKLNAGTEVLTESTDNLVIQYTTSGQDLTAAIETTNFIDQAVDTIAIIPAATVVTVASGDIANKSIELFNTGDGEIGGNASADATLTIFVSYRVHTL